MPRSIALDELRELIENGAQLLDVLPQEEYTEAHLPGAVSIPLKQLNAESVEVLDRERPVVAYCWDSL